MSVLQRVRSLVARRLVSTTSSHCSTARRWSSTIKHDPLRVLFCGADHFSIASLRALNEIRLNHPDKVASIDVVCRPGKRVNRGLKEIRELPIKSVAVDELNLPLHQIDTFTGWAPPRPQDESINLIVAVSFGLLVPPRILNSAKYGGLNVHPSMLPDLAGSAPLHHALLQHDKTTGVTLQTLHPKHFDQGAIVDQTPPPGVPIPFFKTHNYVEELSAFMEPLGADILSKNILSGAFVGPHTRTQSDAAGDLHKKPRHAPKVLPEHREIRWSEWTVKDFLIRDRVIGRLWDMEASEHILHTAYKAPTRSRILYYEWDQVPKNVYFGERKYFYPHLGTTGKAGEPFILTQDPNKRLVFECADGLVSPRLLTIEGKPQALGSRFWKDVIRRDHPSMEAKPLPPRSKPRTAFMPRTRSYSTMPSLASILSTPLPEAPIDHPQISWRHWTATQYLSPQNNPASTFDPITSTLLSTTALSPAKADQTKPSEPRPSHPITLHTFTDITTTHRKLIARGAELYTLSPASSRIHLGAPLFVSRDPAKRLLFFVWADAQRTAIRVLSAQAVEVADIGTVKAEEIWDEVMAKDRAGGRMARVVRSAELRDVFLTEERGRRVVARVRDGNEDSLLYQAPAPVKE